MLAALEIDSEILPKRLGRVKAQWMAALPRDAQFLQDHNIIDYSFLMMLYTNNANAKIIDYLKDYGLRQKLHFCWNALGCVLWGFGGAFVGLLGAMGSYGDLWAPLGTSRGLWGPIGTYRDLWGPMGTSRDLWGPMGTSRDLWGPMAQRASCSCIR